MRTTWFRFLLGGVGLAVALSMATSIAAPAPGAEAAQVVLSLDLGGCPEGTALEFAQVAEKRRRFGPPNPEVDMFFAGWTPGLSGWKGVTSCMQVVQEEGRSVLVCSPGPAMPGRTLVGGATTWSDCTIEATVRLLRQTLIPMQEAYGEHTCVPHVGVFARSVDTIRFYMLALEPGRLSLYRKEQDEWVTLDRRARDVDPGVGYTLQLRATGAVLEGYIDGDPAVRARDTVYRTGKVGVRFNAEARVLGARVLMTPAQKAQADAAETARLEEQNQARARYAKPVVLRTVSLPGVVAYPARLRSPDRVDLIVVGGGKTSAVDTEGNILWQHAGHLSHVAGGGPDATGLSRVAGLAGGKLVMLNGLTGELLHETTPPPRLIYQSWRLANLTGKGEVNYVARSGDNTPDFTVYDETLSVLFEGKATIQVGHTYGIGYWDVDGDGVEELQAGGSCFRGDGSHVWDSRVTEAHLDQVVLGPLGPYGEPTSVFLGVDEGVTFVDGLSGARISCVPNGHPQGVVAGNLRPDLPGVEVLTVSRWASYGVTGLFTGRGELLKQWMLAGEELPMLGLPVTWGDDGGDLILTSLLFRPPTLYDGCGHEIFSLPESPGYRQLFTLFPLDVTGDGRDEILSIAGTTLTIYTQDRPSSAGTTRPSTVKWVNMSLPAWALKPGPNLLPNSSFEDTAEDGSPAGWRLYGAAGRVEDSALAFDGTRALRVNFDNSAWAEFAVKPDTVYAATGMVRHDLHAARDPGRLKIVLKDSDGAVVGASAARLFGLSADAYTGFYHTFRTPAGASTCSFGLCGRFTGTDFMIYDHVAVREVPLP